MTHNRPAVWRLALSAGALVALCGCARPQVTPVTDGLSAAEPAPHGPDAADDPRAEDAPAFRFPDDAGGALLAKVLPPADVQGPPDDPGGGPRRPPAALDARPPALPLPPGQPAPPPVPGERARKAPAPHLTVEETLGPGRGDPLPPEPRFLPVGDRIRLPSPDVNQPIPLPILAQPTADRAPLDDPTADASAEAAVAAPMPQRTAPVPYSRTTLPDPYDNRRPLSLPVPTEDDNPRTGTVHPPKP